MNVRNAGLVMALVAATAAASSVDLFGGRDETPDVRMLLDRRDLGQYALTPPPIRRRRRSTVVRVAVVDPTPYIEAAQDKRARRAAKRLADAERNQKP